MIIRVAGRAALGGVCALVCGIGLATSPDDLPSAVACTVDLSDCVAGFFIIDTCDQASTNPDYNPCKNQSCSNGVCQPGVNVPNLTPCNDAFSASAPLPNGACTRSSLLSMGLAGWPNYFGCFVTSGQAESVDCPPNHKCLCGGAVCESGQGGVCVCNDGGCGGVCNDVCLSGVCTHDIVVIEPDPLQFISSTSMQWPSSGGATHWNTYRGTIPAALLASRPLGGLYDHVCFESANALGDGPTVSTDAALPSAGTALYYLVGAEGVRCDTAIGHTSGGADIPNPAPCPTPP